MILIIAKNIKKLILPNLYLLELFFYLSIICLFCYIVYRDFSNLSLGLLSLFLLLPSCLISLSNLVINIRQRIIFMENRFFFDRLCLSLFGIIRIICMIFTVCLTFILLLEINYDLNLFSKGGLFSTAVFILISYLFSLSDIVRQYKQQKEQYIHFKRSLERFHNHYSYMAFLTRKGFFVVEDGLFSYLIGLNFKIDFTSDILYYNGENYNCSRVEEYLSLQKKSFPELDHSDFTLIKMMSI